MKRIVAMAVLFLLVGAASAFAQEAQKSDNPPSSSVVTAGKTDATAPEVTAPETSPAPRPFSKAAIEKAVAATGATVPPQTKKPFLKTPWPYVIAGAVAVILIFALRGSDPIYA